MTVARSTRYDVTHDIDLAYSVLTKREADMARGGDGGSRALLILQISSYRGDPVTRKKMAALLSRGRTMGIVVQTTMVSGDDLA